MAYASRAPRPAIRGSVAKWCCMAPPLGHEWMVPAGPYGVVFRRCLCEALGVDEGYLALKGTEVNIPKQKER